MQKMYVANKGVLINPEGKLLVLIDSGEAPHHENMVARWDLPGGRMDKGEMPREALARELREEVGVAIDPEKAELFFTHKWGVRGDIENEPVVGLFYKIDVGAIEVKLSKEHSAFHWKTVDEILSDAFQNKSPVSVKEAVQAFKDRFLS